MMKKIRRIITAIAGLLLLSCAEEAEVSRDFEDFAKISRSISNKTVNAFAEDRTGCMWIATDRGLNRYNGYDYHCWYHTDDPASLSSNQVKSIAVDEDGSIWCGTINGICRYTEEGDFQPYPIDDSGYAIDFFLTQSSRLVACTQSCLAVYDRQKDSFDIIDRFNNNYGYYSMDGIGRIWKVGQGELSWWDVDKGTRSEKTFTYEGLLYARHTQDGRYIWMSVDGCLKIFDCYTESFISLPAPLQRFSSGKEEDGIRTILGSTDGKVLLFTNSLRLYEWNPKASVLKETDVSGLTDEHMVGILSTTLVDSSGNLWVGTSDQGFGLLRARKTRFNNDESLSDALAAKSVTSLCRLPGNSLLINTNGYGVYRWSSGTVTHLTVRGVRNERTIQRLTALSDGYVYATAPYTVMKMKVSGNVLEAVKTWRLPVYQLYDITEDSCGRLWVGSFSDDVFIIGKDSDEAVTFNVGHGSRTYSMCQTVVPIGGGKLAAAVIHYGVVLIDERTLETDLVPFSDFNDDDVFLAVCSYFDSKGRLWIGTRGQGLFLYTDETRSIEKVPHLESKDITAIIEDGTSRLWISTLDGLYRYDAETDKLSGFFASDGTGGDQYNEAAAAVLADGSPVFGGTHGATLVNGADDGDGSKTTIVFEDVFINNGIQHAYKSPVLESQLNKSRSLRLKQGRDVNVGISFSTVDYGLWPSTHFSYRLEGFENDWIDSRNNRSAFYSNLPAGRYRFCVRAWNTDYSSVLAEDSIDVTVTPPWYLSWWMKWLVYPLATILLAIAFLVSYLRIRRSHTAVEEARRQSETEKHINDMNMRFFVNVSHEMRTPLSVIRGPLELLVTDKSIGDENHRLLKIMSRNVNRLLRYINQLMDVSKLENDTLALKVRYCDISVLVSNMLDTFRISADEKNIEIVSTGLDDSFIFLFDEDKMEKILSNLLSNAVKFTGNGGRIEISMNTDSGDMVLSVANSGPEIPEEDLEKIFLRYYQVASTGGKYNYGTGIGLYYSRRLVELHHGSIEAHNRPDGAGPVFTVRIPYSEQAYSASERAEDDDVQTMTIPSPALNEPDAENDKADGKPVLLVVEDDTEMARFLKTIFTGSFKVVNRYDADTSLADMATINPDIIICDVMMPGTRDGMDLCREIKNNSDTCHLPVILLTAKVTTEAQVEGLNCGADAYITKPFEPSYLMASVRSLLANRERLRNSLGSATQTSAIKTEQLSPMDREFMDSLYELMEKSLSSPELNTTGIAEAMHVSRTKLYYKIKALTGDNPNSFFRTYKLNRAAELLREGRYNISEVANITGFSTLSHFSTSFKKQFGVSPSSFV
jgi:signal transduction histidine kinase/DNA-binding response OmpR family regulator